LQGKQTGLLNLNLRPEYKGTFDPPILSNSEIVVKHFEPPTLDLPPPPVTSSKKPEIQAPAKSETKPQVPETKPQDEVQEKSKLEPKVEPKAKPNKKTAAAAPAPETTASKTEEKASKASEKPAAAPEKAVPVPNPYEEFPPTTLKDG
jgi:hypothetical protein